MKTHRRVGLLALLFVVLAAPAMAVRPGGGPLPRGFWQGSRDVNYHILEEGQYGPWMNPALILIRSQEEWAPAMVAAGAVIPVAAPSVDWNRNAIILMVLGRQPFGGYNIQVTEAARHAQDLVLKVHITFPPEPNTPQNFSSPYQMLVVETWRFMGVKAEYDAIVPDLASEVPRLRRRPPMESQDPERAGERIGPAIEMKGETGDSEPIRRTTWGSLKSGTP